MYKLSGYRIVYVTYHKYIMKRHLSSLFLLFLLISFGSAAQAQSLWQDGANLYADPKPSRVGDIVTVIVEESIRANDEANTDLT